MRRNHLVVEDFGPLHEGTWYAVIPITVQPNGRSRCLSVTVKHVGTDQLGRTHIVELPLPIRPSGITAEFVQACGLEVAVGQEINPQKLVRCTVEAMFSLDEGGHVYAVGFRKPKKGR